MARLKINTDPGWQLKYDDDKKKARLDIYDVIGDDWFGGVSAKDVAAELKAHANAEEIEVHINSPGGSAFDGITIYNVLSQHKANVTVHIDGLAASAASVIAMAGDEIHMAENAMMMIHNASGFTFGDANVHREQVELLDKLDRQIAITYARRTGGDEQAIRDLMADETWFTAEEAVADGFATNLVQAKRAVAMFDPAILNQYRNAPAAVAERFMKTDKAGDPAATEGEVMKDMTPEAFAEKNPDAVTNWKTEAVESLKAEHEQAIQAAKVEATDEAIKLERERCMALINAFGKHPAFLAKQIQAGHELGKAKAEAFDAKLGLDDGHEGLNLRQPVNNNAEESSDDPVVAFEAKVDEHVANGKSRSESVRLAVRENPELHRNYIQAVNSR